MIKNKKTKNRKTKRRASDNLRLLNSYARWSSFAFQMALVVVAAYLLGNEADKFYKRDDSLFTLIAVIIGVIAAMVMAVRSVNSLKNKK